jgi:hypothetical protein
MSFSSQDKPFVVSGSLFLASFALNAYMAMFTLPISQYELIEWVSWILGIGGVITFCSAIINHKGHR